MSFATASAAASAFQNYSDGYLPDGVNVYQPIKKRRGKPRTPDEKLYNREISRIRVRVEHTISGIKRSGIVSRTYRNRRKGFDDLSVIVAGGLHNFRTEMRNKI